MKRMSIVLMLVLLASVTQAGTIIDLQTEVYTVGAHVEVVGAVVTEVSYNGFFMGEIPTALYSGVWVYDNGVNVVAIGDIVSVGALYEEYHELTELNVLSDAAGYVTVTGWTDCLLPLCVTIAELNANPEPYESVWIQVMDGMMVTELLTYGMWEVESYDTTGEFLLMDDYWYDDTTVQVGDCYFCATGIYVWNYDFWKLNPHVDGLSLVDCSVPNEEMTIGDVKKLYR